MDAAARETSAAVRVRRSRVGPSAADLNFLQRLPRVRDRNFKSNAAPEFYLLAPLLSEVRERGRGRDELWKAGASCPDAGIQVGERCLRITSDDALHRTEVMSLSHRAGDGDNKARSPGSAE